MWQRQQTDRMLRTNYTKRPNAVCAEWTGEITNTIRLVCQRHTNSSDSSYTHMNVFHTVRWVGNVSKYMYNCHGSQCFYDVLPVLVVLAVKPYLLWNLMFSFLLPVMISIKKCDISLYILTNVKQLKQKQNSLTVFSEKIALTNVQTVAKTCVSVKAVYSAQ